VPKCVATCAGRSRQGAGRSPGCKSCAKLASRKRWLLPADASEFHSLDRVNIVEDSSGAEHRDCHSVGGRHKCGGLHAVRDMRCVPRRALPWETGRQARPQRRSAHRSSGTCWRSCDATAAHRCSHAAKWHKRAMLAQLRHGIRALGRHSCRLGLSKAFSPLGHV
jgi:hypothetical protein